VHIPNEKRSKFDDKSKKDIFKNYGSNSKDYKFNNHNTRRTIIRQDVFNEGEWD